MQTLEQLNKEAPILKKTVDLYKEFYQYIKSFPKRDQYMLGKRCEDYIVCFIELLLEAVGLQKSKKLKTLEQASNKFDTLKVLFRMAKELKMLDNKKYLSLQEKQQEISKMLGGWIRSLQQKFVSSKHKDILIKGCLF